MSASIYTSAPFLEINRLTKQWGDKTISLSCSLAKGEALALLGPSGCGKSTILSMIAGLLRPDSGSVMLNGSDITAVPAGKRHIGMVFQDYALFPHLTVEDNIGYGLVSAGMTKKESRAAAAEWIQHFGLQGMAKRNIAFLSGGEKQRVALARTLALNPLAVLFDEPLSALDTELRIKLRKELSARQKEIGYTAIYVTHDREEAGVLANRIIEMEQ